MQNILALLLCFLSLFGFSQDASLKYCNLISADSIKQYLLTLASDSLEGRETGQRGQKRAAHFLVSKYRSWGLNHILPANHSRNKIFTADDSEYLQDHTISIKNNKGRNLSVNGDNYLYGKDFIYSPASSDTALFINHLLFSGSNNLKDLQQILKSERYIYSSLIVYNDVENSSSLIDAISKSHKQLTAVFIITSPDSIKKKFVEGLEKSNPAFTVFFVTEEIARNILTPDKFDKAKRKITKRKKEIIRELDCDISVGLIVNTDELSGENVVAYIKGEMANETIVISSHYDHLGIKDSCVYYGADDNASGTSAVLELARVFSIAANQGHRPKRNLLFLNVSGEEKGLLGSTWFVNNPPIPLNEIINDLNIDMIGRTDTRHDSSGIKNYVYIIGADKLSTELSGLNEAQNKIGPNLVLDYTYNTEDEPNHFYRRSDHYNFAKNGIPIIFYFDGIHVDYHKPTDTPDKIDMKLLTERARLVFLTAWELANRKQRVVIDGKPNR